MCQNTIERRYTDRIAKSTLSHSNIFLYFYWTVPSRKLASSLHVHPEHQHEKGPCSTYSYAYSELRCILSCPCKCLFTSHHTLQLCVMHSKFPSNGQNGHRQHNFNRACRDIGILLRCVLVIIFLFSDAFFVCSVLLHDLERESKFFEPRIAFGKTSRFVGSL